MSIAFLMMVLLYVAVPVVVYCVSGEPSDPLSSHFGGTPTAVGSACMRARARHTLSYVKPTGIVCEIGVGRGIIGDEARQLGMTYWVIDMDEDLLEAIESEHSWCQRVPPLPKDMQPCDAFVLESLMEHLPDHESAYMLLLQCYITLNDGGIVVIRVPDIRYAQWRFWDSAPDHVWVTSVRRVATVGREAGFNIEDYGLYLDQFTGWKAKVVYWGKSIWPWQMLHGMCYEPWQESAFSKLAEKVPSCYMVLRK